MLTVSPWGIRTGHGVQMRKLKRWVVKILTYDGLAETRHLNSVPWNSKATLPEWSTGRSGKFELQMNSDFFCLFSNVLYLLKFLSLLKSVYFWLCWVFVAVSGLSLVSESGGYPPAAVLGLLTVVAPLVCGLRLGCSEACGISPGQGSDLCPLHWLVDS